MPVAAATACRTRAAPRLSALLPPQRTRCECARQEHSPRPRRPRLSVLLPPPPPAAPAPPHDYLHYCRCSGQDASGPYRSILRARARLVRRYFRKILGNWEDMPPSAFFAFDTIVFRLRCTGRCITTLRGYLFTTGLRFCEHPLVRNARPRFLLTTHLLLPCIAGLSDKGTEFKKRFGCDYACVPANITPRRLL